MVGIDVEVGQTWVYGPVVVTKAVIVDDEGCGGAVGGASKNEKKNL